MQGLELELSRPLGIGIQVSKGSSGNGVFSSIMSEAFRRGMGK